MATWEKRAVRSAVCLLMALCLVGCVASPESVAPTATPERITTTATPKREAPTATKPPPWVPWDEDDTFHDVELEIERMEERVQEAYEEYLREQCEKAWNECEEKCIDENCPDCEDRTFDAAHEYAMDICYSHGEDEYSAVCYQDVFTEAYDTFYEVFCWACWDECLEECYLPCP